MIPIETTEDIADALLLLRRLRGLTQPEVAEPSGTDFSQISKYERGVSVPGVSKLIAVLGALGYALAIVPLAPEAPTEALSASVADQGADIHTHTGVDQTNGATGLSEAFCCNRGDHPGHFGETEEPTTLQDRPDYPTEPCPIPGHGWKWLPADGDCWECSDCRYDPPKEA